VPTVADRIAQHPFPDRDRPGAGVGCGSGCATGMLVTIWSWEDEPFRGACIVAPLPFPVGALRACPSEPGSVTLPRPRSRLPLGLLADPAGGLGGS
jgi:hypothetical protein